MAKAFAESSEENYINKDVAISADIAGMRIFESPDFAFGDARDALFCKLKEPFAIGEHFMLPEEWLCGAKTVVSFFLPFTENVRKSNAKMKDWPSNEWLHGRYEGQFMVEKLCLFIQNALIDAGYPSVAPCLDKRFRSKNQADENERESSGLAFTSNWSERHVAFICGHGTFGLSKGLITKHGIAGRFGSIVTTMHLTADERDYRDIYENCAKCGACITQCPVNAISFERGKDHTICCSYLDVIRKEMQPRHGCGKCQVDTPCETGIPVCGS